MEFYGNSTDPLAKTLKELKESGEKSSFGDAGDFFKPVHERDTHVKPTNQKDEPIEFNAALLNVDDSAVMLQYVVLKNKIVDEECLGLEESNHVDKDTGATTVFIKWLQPKGMFELGTANLAIKMPNKKPPTPEEALAEHGKGEDVVNDTTTTPKKQKGKGTRKKNKKVKL